MSRDFAQLFLWGALDLPIPQGSFFDASEGWAIISLFKQAGEFF